MRVGPVVAILGIGALVLIILLVLNLLGVVRFS